MVFKKERIEVICAQLKKQMLGERMPLEQLEYKKGRFFRPQEAESAEEPWTRFLPEKDFWYGPDVHYWFKTQYIVPLSQAGKPLMLVLKTQIDEWDDGKNPQFLLFLDGVPVQGLDMNHREVLLCGQARAGQTLDIQFAAYTGTLHSDFRLVCEVRELFAQVKNLYYDLQVPLWGTQRMPADDKTRMDILTVLNNTINLLDFRTLYSAEYFASVTAARAYIAKALYEDMAGYEDVIASCIGHTHIDVAWWWTVEQTKEKVARSFATVLKLMDEYPGYRFMSSQPQLYVFLKEHYPDLYEKVKERIAQKRWEPEGGMWLEADCNLTSGESLVRQFLYGKQFFREEFGVENKVLWLPDVFGYSGALPQICKRSGIDYFMTTKLSWNQFNKVPADTLYWQGIDGSSVFTHFISTLGVGQSPERFFTTYNGMLHPDAIMGGWQRYQDKEINNDILIAFGYGDGGGGPTREMLETSLRMEKGVKGIPKVRQVFSEDYFRELKEKIGADKRVPKWVGEFYFEYHRGTYTSMARNKRSNRKSEFLLMDLELLSVLAAVETNGMEYPREELERLWKVLLLNQFHDILPGSSIHEVYEVTKREYAELAETGGKLLRQRAEGIAGSGDNVVLFNTLGFDRDDIVNLGDFREAAVCDDAGNVYPVQQTEKGALCHVQGLPAKGYQSFARAEKAAVPDAFTLTGYTAETPFYTVEFDENGNIISLFDRKAERELVPQNQVFNLLRMYEDKPIYYDNWDIDVFYTEKFWDIGGITKLQWIENGAVCTTLRIERAFSNSLMRQDIRFYANSPRIDFETWVDWKESQHLLKVHFPLNFNTDEATFDIQFGNVRRKTHKNTSWEQARFESCAHKWIDVAEGDYGVSLLNDCKYGHSVDDGVLGLTLIKSGIEPNPVTDQEEHFFTYSLLPHSGTWQSAWVEQEAYKLNQPVFAASGEAGKRFSFAKPLDRNIILETVKQAETGTGTIFRMYESQNTRKRTALWLHKAPKAAWSCDLIENKEERLSIEGQQVIFEIKPYEIKTICVEW